MHRQALRRVRVRPVVVHRRRYATAPPPPDPPDPPQPKIRRTRNPSSTKDFEPVLLPDALDVLWSHHPPPHDDDLPPPENLQDALNNLLISLHPQTQHRATFPSPLGPPTEPTLALYSPLEGGDYIIDATVRELARQTHAEVLVLDAAHLAAGEWGHFGPAANSLSLPRNPLHFPSAVIPPSPPNSQSPYPDEDDYDIPFPMARKMTLTVIPQPLLHARTILASPSRSNVPPSKIKVFFDTLVNLPSDSSKGHPRLVYVRDFPTLAPSSSLWYPPLLSAVRERRRGPMSRPSSPVCNPMTIIFGITPPLAPQNPQSSFPTTGTLHLLSHRSSTTFHPVESKSGKPADWGEDEAAEAAREKRLRDRLRKWDKGEALILEELPKLSNAHEGEASDNDKADIILVGPSGLSPFPGMGPSVPGYSSSQADVSFFRTSILIPRTRSIPKERKVRVARRREINELTMRMGIGAAGGVLEQENAAVALLDVPGTTEDAENNPTSQTTVPSMWEEWGNKIETWTNVRRIADHAIGKTLAAERPFDKVEEEKVTLDSTIVPWSTVHRAWHIHRSCKDLRTSWLRDTFLVQPIREQEEVDEPSQDQTDQVVERIKNDEDLDPHEERLLPCIVDAASMPTSFDQVHLPPHTIDSVRTIVSLPLLHPRAFQQGILRDHAMTGCLLFGPPGTGKTLVVRALAKEAGCRMLTISPSDVMDMYVGEGEKLVKAVFSLARKLSPCVVFLDEIDALFGARMSARENGGAFAHRGVITEFMQEMDGLKSSKDDRVIMIGATNRPFDLDDAVLRRLPRRLLVDLPGERERAEILKILLRNENLAPDVDIGVLAKQTESYSGSDLKHLCVSAALDAVKEHVHLPWSTSPSPLGPSPDASRVPLTHGNAPPTDTPTPIPDEPLSEPDVRILKWHNFSKALKEITPSSSESLSSLTDLRKWNDEFGEGRRDRKRQQFWGKGRFGFTDKRDQEKENAKVLESEQ